MLQLWSSISVSLYLSAVEAGGIWSATVCYRTGVDALRLIAAELTHRRGAPAPARGRQLARADFDAACDRLTALGAEVKAGRDACWLRFVELREEYETVLARLAQSLLVPRPENPLLSFAAPDRATPISALVSGNTDDEAL